MQNITASVGFGGRNLPSDTLVVQGLLNQSSTPTGPPLVVDGFVGPKTIAAIRAFQTSQFGKADGRVDPGGPTITALNQSGSDTPDRVQCDASDLGGGTLVTSSPTQFAFASFSSDAGAPALTPKDDALANKLEALAWLAAALNALQVVRGLMQTGLTADALKLQQMVEFQAVNIHFHLDRHPDPLRFLSNLGKNYSLMSIAVAGAEKNFENDFVSDNFANSDAGGFSTRNDATNPGRMFFCLKYLGTGPLTHVVTIIHEAAHYIDSKIDHFASGVPAPAGRPLEGTGGQSHSNNYQQLTPDEAFHNAGSYAGFAIHTFKRQDIRPFIMQ